MSRAALAALVLLAACEDGVGDLSGLPGDAGSAAPDARVAVDSGFADAGAAADAGSADAAPPDAGAPAGLRAPDAYRWRVAVLEIEEAAFATDLAENDDVLARVRTPDPMERVGPRVWRGGAWRRLEALAAFPTVIGHRLNDRGQVIGVAVPPEAPAGGSRPFRYDVDAQAVTWIPPEVGRNPQDLTREGAVLLFTAAEDSARPSRWAGPGAMPVRLSTAGMSRGAPVAMAEDGSVVGNAIRNQSPHPVWWRTPDDIVELAPPDTTGNVAAVSPNGRFAVGRVFPPGGPTRPALWIDGALSATALPATPEIGADVNDAGWVLLGRDGLAFEGVAYPLDDLVDVSAFEEVAPVALNNRGVILATVTIDGRPQPALLIPEG